MRAFQISLNMYIFNETRVLASDHENIVLKQAQVLFVFVLTYGLTKYIEKRLF